MPGAEAAREAGRGLDSYPGSQQTYLERRDVSDVGFLLRRKFLWTDDDITRLCKSKNSSPHSPKAPREPKGPKAMMVAGCLGGKAL